MTVKLPNRGDAMSSIQQFFLGVMVALTPGLLLLAWTLRRRGVDAMFGDPRGADEIATLSMILGPIFGRAVPWKQGIEAVKRNMRIQPDGMPKLLIHPRCINTIKEIEGLRVKKGPTDIKNAVEGQRDKDDHTCDALRYFFSEYYVLGAGGSLRDVVQPREDETFFKLVAGEGFTYGDRIDF